MIEVTLYRRTKIGVFGLGKSGQAAIYSLISGGAELIAWDDDENKRKMLIDEARPENILLNFRGILVNIDDVAWQDIQCLILSPGIPLSHKIVEIARKNHILVTCDIELLYQTCSRAQYIGITGTNGKSTTVALLGHILQKFRPRVEIGGNIGVPALDLQPLAIEGTYVLELSSYQLGLLDKTHFNIAILLNITPDHLEYHGNMENYIKAKTRIFAYQGKNDIAIISVDNQYCATIYTGLLAQKQIGNIIPISTEKRIKGGVAIVDNILYNDSNFARDQIMEVPIAELVYLRGKHNQENLAAAFAASIASGLSLDEIMDGVNSFKSLPHRMQLVGQIGPVLFINDSKATNIESAAKSLASFDNIYWIVGGVAKEGSNLAELAAYFPHIAHIFLIGQTEDDFAEILTNYKLPFTKCQNLDNATRMAAEQALKQLQPAVILLAPACASYDQWANFEARGEAFCNIVVELKANNIS